MLLAGGAGAAAYIVLNQGIENATATAFAVAGLVINYLRRRAGIVFTPHQFRHLGAKVVLDCNPGEFETVKQLLGHRSIKTTVVAYAGIDSRRAARRHQYLVEQALAAEIPMRRSKRRHREPLESRSDR